MVKRLTSYIMDLGRLVAYYPNLKKITGSTTATIFLCQLLYWTGKSQDGWIWKTHYEIEEETGLSVYEQKTAKMYLESKGIITVEIKPMTHNSRYKVNEDILNDLWEENSGKVSERTEEEHDTQPVKKEKTKSTILKESLETAVVAHQTAAVKKGDAVDWALIECPQADRQREIYELLRKKLHILPNNKQWESFIRFMYKMEEKEKWKADDFIAWAIKEGFDPKYWTPEKMKTMYPRAFVKDEEPAGWVDYVSATRAKDPREIAPMPDNLGRKKEEF